MDALALDLRFALRLIRKSPGISVATIVTLALGVGLNAGVFSIVNGLLFKPRVTADPASFVSLQPAYSGSRAPRHEAPLWTTEDYRALRDRTTTLDALAAWTVVHARFGPEASDTLPLLVSCNFFTVFGLERLERGRVFRPEECELPAAKVAVISADVWRRYFDADPEIVGKPLLMNRQPFTIVGVTPALFPGRVRGEGIWVPYTNQAALRQGVSIYDDVGTAWLRVEGRLKHGVSRDRAAVELNVLARQQDALRGDRTTLVALTNGATIHDPGVAQVAVYVVPLVLGSVALVLFTACGNVALLLLSRAVTRRREIAIRLAIGCGRARLFRLLLTESVLFGVLGMPIAAWIAWQVPLVMRALIPVMPFYAMQPDATVFSYLAAASFAAGVVAGITPIAESLRRRLTLALDGDDMLGGRGRSRSRLIAAQVAASAVLLSGTALLLRVETVLMAPDPALDGERVLVANYDPPPGASPVLFTQTVARLAALPGVSAVAYGHGSAGELGGEGTVLSVRGGPAPVRRVAVNLVSASYFQTLHRTIVQGRPLRDPDRDRPAAGAVVSEALARVWWPRGGAIGAIVETPEHIAFEIVGIVRGDAALAGASFDPFQMYVLAPSAPPSGQVLLRFAGDRRVLQSAVHDALRDLGPASASLPTTLAAANAAMGSALMPLVDMVGTLALTAIVLALVGIYGVVVFAISRRTREIGVRMALGATRGDIMRLIVTSGARPVAAGLAAGFLLVIPGAIALSRIFERTPVPVRVGDPIPYLIVAVVLAAAAVTTMILPARRAAAIAPSIALRSE